MAGGLGSLIQGFQQGFDWVDGAQRKAADDKFVGESRDHQRTEWQKEADLVAERKALYEQHFGKQPAPDAALEPSPDRSLAAEQGSMVAAPTPTPVAQPVMQPPQAAPVVAPVAAMSPAPAQMPPNRGKVITPQFLANMEKAESNGNMNAVGPYIPGQGRAQGAMQVMPNTLKDPGYGVRPAASSDPVELKRVGVDYANAMGDLFGNQVDAAIAFNWGPGNAKK